MAMTCQRAEHIYSGHTNKKIARKKGIHMRIQSIRSSWMAGERLSLSLYQGCGQEASTIF